jgi:hypothetical protein
MKMNAPIPANEYADHLVSEEKDETVITEKYRCYDCGEIYEGHPAYVLTDYHGDETPFCSECKETYGKTIFADKFGL